MFISKKKFEAEIEKARESAYRETECRIHENDKDRHLNDVLRDINRRLITLEDATALTTAQRACHRIETTTDVGYWV